MLTVPSNNANALHALCLISADYTAVNNLTRQARNVLGTQDQLCVARQAACPNNTYVALAMVVLVVQDTLSPHSPASNQVVPFGSRAGGNADMMWGDPYPSRMNTSEGRQL